MDISVVIPVYNSQQALAILVQRLQLVLQEHADEFELILVNDGSRDRSWEVITELASRHGWVRGLDLMRNFGQHNALLTGIRAARYDVTITMDDDLQNPPEEIPKLLAELGPDVDVVYGTPARGRHGLRRNLASWMIKLALRAGGVTAARHVSAFRALRTCVRDAFAGYDSHSVSIDVLLTWGTTRFAATKVQHESRGEGRSNYSFRRLVGHAVTMLTGFSTLPLRLASFMGLFFTLFGVAVLAYVVGRYYLQGSSVPGFPFLASVLAIFSGAILFALGIIGEYLARMYFRSLGRPVGCVRRSVGHSDSNETT